MPEQLPLFPLGTVLFPGMILPLHIFEQRYQDMLAMCLESDPIFGVVLIRGGREVGEKPEVHNVGTAATLLRAVRYSDGRYDIAVRGGRRFRVRGGHWEKGYLTAEIDWLETEGVATITSEAQDLLAPAIQSFLNYLTLVEAATSVSIERADLGGDPIVAGYAISEMLPLAAVERQRLLEADSPAARLRDLLQILRRERDLLRSTGIGGAAANFPGSGFSQN